MKTKRTLLREIQDSLQFLQSMLTDYTTRIRNEIHDLKRTLIMKTDELLAKVDSTTNETATRVQALIDAIKAQNGNLTPDQETEANNIIAHLQAIGADPANPVPPIPPTVL